MADLKKLLRKRSWTGRELGQILLASLADEYKQALDGNYTPTPLVPGEKFSKMLHSLTDQVQQNTYNNYYSIGGWLRSRPAITNDYYTCGEKNFATIGNYIAQAIFAEDVYRYVEQLPDIMTQKQFDELKAERVEAYFKDADGEELESNVFDLIERATNYYLHQFYNDPRKPNPLKAIRKKYITQPVESKFILSRFNPGIDNLTKWDIIEQKLLLELYPADIDGSGDEYSESNFTASMQDFYTEFKELVTVMLADMDEKYEVKASNISIEKWESTLISWRTLYEWDFYGERDIAEGEIQLFSDNKRALLNGIAILKPSNSLGKSRYIDENGYYVEPDISQTISSHSLEAFFTDSENYKENIASVEDARNELLKDYYFLMGYNKQIDLVIALTDVPELEIFKRDIKGLEGKIQTLNDLADILYKQIEDTDYKDKELKAHKIEVLKNVFPPLDIDSLTIPKENIEQAQQLVNSFKAFRGQHMLFESLLCDRPKDEDGEGAD